jgi:uncharacterized protein (DUF952 family)
MRNLLLLLLMLLIAVIHAQLSETILFKCVSESVFKSRIHDSKFQGNPDESQDGYMHFSAIEEAVKDCETYHGDVLDLWLLRVNTTLLTNPSKLRWEKYPGSESLFPHLYDELNLSAIVKIYTIPFNQTTHKHIYPPLKQ